MDDDEMRARMGASSLDKYRRLYSNGVIFAEWESLFLEAVAESSADEKTARSAHLCCRQVDCRSGSATSGLA